MEGGNLEPLLIVGCRAQSRPSELTVESVEFPGVGFAPQWHVVALANGDHIFKPPVLFVALTASRMWSNGGKELSVVDTVENVGEDIRVRGQLRHESRRVLKGIHQKEDARRNGEEQRRSILVCVLQVVQLE